MPTFDTAERSQALSRRVILYEIATSAGTYRHTTSVVDRMWAGQLYTSLTITNDAAQVTSDPSGGELVIHLPISHPVVQRFAATGIPPQEVNIRVLELQTEASEAALAWSGAGQSLTINGHTAAIRVPTATNDGIKVTLPMFVAAPHCQHVLFDRGCSPNPGGAFPYAGAAGSGGPVRNSPYLLDIIVASISADGLTVTGAYLGGAADHFFQYGTITLTTVNGEEQTKSIVDQVGLTITLQVPFVGAGGFAGVAQLVAGCDHTIATCVSKFANRVNFGGHPQMRSAANLWVPNGLGVIQQV